MKKIIALLVTALMLINISGCGSDKNTADSYADKLASGEIKPNVEKADGDSSEKSEKKRYKNDSEDDKKSEKSEKNSTDKEEEDLTQMPVRESDKAEKSDSTAQSAEKKEASSVAEKQNVELPLSNAEMGAFIDAFDDEYESFEVAGMPSADFYMGKTLRLAAVIAGNQLSQVIDQNVRATFTPQQLTILSPDESGKDLKAEYSVFSHSDSVLKSPAGRDFSYITYGGAESNGDSFNGVIGMFARIVCKKPEAMGDAIADEYIMLIESGQPDVYQVFMAQ